MKEKIEAERRKKDEDNRQAIEKDFRAIYGETKESQEKELKRQMEEEWAARGWKLKPDPPKEEPPKLRDLSRDWRDWVKKGYLPGPPKLPGVGPPRATWRATELQVCQVCRAAARFANTIMPSVQRGN